ncbi:MAG: TerB family tellurite resistance protein [Aquificaceae bacterium]|nr:TerB family tellurite resistance protein [Aquificaceae bacterium]MDW8424115.1 TerB family tellurite resistance protein [Aquificaceae bacterium]
MSREELAKLISVMAHAMLADGKIHDKEMQMLRNTAVALGLETLDDFSNLPALDSLIKKEDDVLFKTEVLDVCMETLSVDGELNEEEKAFFIRVCQLLGIEEDKAQACVQVIQEIAQKRQEFNMILSEIFSSRKTSSEDSGPTS